MCVTVAAMALSGVMSVAQGFAQAGAAKAAQKSREQQMRIDMELDEIATLDAEDERRDRMRRDMAANMAAQSSAGLRSNRSFLEGVRGFNEDQARGDLTAIRFNSNQRNARTELAIRTDKASTKSSSRNAIIGGIAGGISSGLQGYGAWKKVQVPGGGTPTGTNSYYANKYVPKSAQRHGNFQR